MLPRGRGYTRRLVIHLQQFSTTGLTYDPRPRFYTPPPNPKSLLEFQVFCQPMKEDVGQLNLGLRLLFLLSCVEYVDVSIAIGYSVVVLSLLTERTNVYEYNN